MAANPTKSLTDEIASLSLNDEFSGNAVPEDINVAEHEPYVDFHDFCEDERDPYFDLDDLLDTENEPYVDLNDCHYNGLSIPYANLDDILNGEKEAYAELLDMLIGKNLQYQNEDNIHGDGNNSY